MKTYWITFKVDARFECPIDADSMEEALEKAEGRFRRCGLWRGG